MRVELHHAIIYLREAVEFRERAMAGAKHSRALSDSPTEKEAKQPKASDSPKEKVEGEVQVQEEPSEREVKAALAARERLYGNNTRERATEVGCQARTYKPPTSVLQLFCCFAFCILRRTILFHNQHSTFPKALVQMCPTVHPIAWTN